MLESTPFWNADGSGSGYGDLARVPFADSMLLAANVVNASAEELCFLQRTAEELLTDLACPTFFDSVSCWPRTPPATLAILPCMTEFKGVQYDNTQNASRYCNINGTWDNYTNYDECQHVSTSPLPDFEPHIELPTIVYFTGYSISLAALVLAVTVLVNFKDLRCLRNTIHINLFLTYIMSSSLWMLILSLQMTIKTEIVDCIFLVTLFHYFSTTNFFWMLVEGLYLYMLVVQTFSGDNLRFRKYALIGWGGPLIFVGAWALTRPFYLTEATVSTAEHPNKLEIECSWMRESHIDWIIQGPTCAVLVINLIFLLRIMWGFVVSLLYCFLNSEVRQTLRHHFYRWRDERNILRPGGANKAANNHRRPTISKDYSPRSRTESIRVTTTSAPLI